MQNSGVGARTRRRNATVATFYLLPPRPLLGRHFAAYLESLFPGLNWTRNDPRRLTETLETLTAGHDDAFLIYREELASDLEPATALREDFGAEAGDEVVELRAGARPGELTAQRWSV